MIKPSSTHTNTKPGSNAAAPRIFVQIAAYRDPECQHTVRDLFEQAAYPERVFVGILWQGVPEQDQDCLQLVTRPEQVRTKQVHARDSRGVCWARHHAQQLWDGEEYTLQIDSHMRFEPGWDERLLEMLAQCDSERPLLTTYPPAYTPPRTLYRNYLYSMRPKEFSEDGILLLTYQRIPVAEAPAAPIPGSVGSACFMFGPAQIIEDVPYDPHLYFFGEEISLSVRLWTHGWDFFYPNQQVLYHYWSREGRSTHFADHKDWGKLDTRSKQRVAHLLGTLNSADPEVLVELEHYGLGSARTLADYQAHSGIDFHARTF